MAHLMLNCPTCRKPLTYVPLDGLTLHYRCRDHGLLIFRPLVEISHDDQDDRVPTYPRQDEVSMHASGAA